MRDVHRWRAYLAAAAFSLLIASLAFEKVTLDCDRAADLCSIDERRSPFQHSAWSLPVSVLAGARLWLDTGSHHQLPNIVLLKRDGGSWQLSSWQHAGWWGRSQDRAERQASVDAINHFVTDPTQPSVHIQHHGAHLPALLAAALAAWVIGRQGNRTQAEA